MKDITNYINEAQYNTEELMREAKYYADLICISLAFIDLYKLMMDDVDDEKILNLMYDISGDVSEYNYSVPKNITKYEQSTTNVTCDDWISKVKYLMFNDKTYDYVKDLIVKDKNSDYTYFGTSFTKKALKRILDLYKEHYDKKGFKELISKEKKNIAEYKQKFNDFKKSLK